MKKVLQQTFGGLSTAYYIRQFLFGLIFPAFIYFVLARGNISVYMFLFSVVSCLLYPYARYVYESIIEYVMGDTIIINNMIVMLVTKIMMMALCWMLAIFIAPVGLIYLYFYHSKKSLDE